MTLDERVKQFRRNFPRPTEWDSERGTMVKMIYDLIDDREDLKTLLVSRDRGGITEEEARLSKDRVMARYDRYPG